MKFKRIRLSLKEKRDENAFREAYDYIETIKTFSADDMIDLFYFDESGFSTSSNIPYAWQKNTIEQPATRSNNRLNVLGFMNLSGELYASYEKGKVTSETVINAFDDFIKNKSSQKNCIVVLDNASIHKSKLFKEAEKRWKEDGVFLVFLPPYSPELNLIEILWRQIKYYWLEFNAYKDFNTLCEHVELILGQYGKKYQITFA